MGLGQDDREGRKTPEVGRGGIWCCGVRHLEGVVAPPDAMLCSVQEGAAPTKQKLPPKNQQDSLNDLLTRTVLHGNS